MVIPDRPRDGGTVDAVTADATTTALDAVATIVLAHGLTVAVAEPRGRESVADRLTATVGADSWFRGALEPTELGVEPACNTGDPASRRAEQAAIAGTRRLRVDVGVGVFQDADRERADGSRATGVAVHVGPLTLSADYGLAGSPRVARARTVDRALSLLLSGLRVHLGSATPHRDISQAAMRGTGPSRRDGSSEGSRPAV